MPRPTLPRSRLTLLLCAILVAATACAPAQGRPLVDVDVIDRDDGLWLPELSHRGRDWIAGIPGHRYSVRLTNTSGERVLVVLSVDGINAVSGQTAHPSQAGYVLAPWQSTEINGWRKSLDDVAQFVFTDLPDSYAARTGRPDDIGVIGIAVFTEQRYERPYPYRAPIAGMPGEAERGARGRSAAKAAAPQASGRIAAESAADAVDATAQGIGTGHGEREWSPVSRTGFVRASRSPVQVAELRYDDPAGLAARGIAPHWRWRPHYQDEPRAFPGGFVADPPR